jgi:hypothetical protein
MNDREGTLIGRFSITLLCADDMIRDPDTGRMMRMVKSTDDDSHSPYMGFVFAMVDGEHEVVARSFRRTSRFKIYT